MPCRFLVPVRSRTDPIAWVCRLVQKIILGVHPRRGADEFIQRMVTFSPELDGGARLGGLRPNAFVQALGVAGNLIYQKSKRCRRAAR